MKITHVDGSVTDTDKLNDLSAELLERTKDFYEFFANHKIPFILRFGDPILKSFGGAFNFNSSHKDYLSMVTDVVNFIQDSSQGTIEVMIRVTGR